MHIQRRLNYTGRRKINKSDVQIQLIQEASGQLKFAASVDFSKLTLPANAPVYIEVRQKDLMQRFACGTVAEFVLPGDTTLKDVDRDGSLSFWVRVLDPERTDGRLLAVARSIHPEGDVPDDAEGRDSLLAVKSRNLGHIPWQIDFPPDEEGIPYLVINSRITDPIARLQNNPLFQGLVLPAAVRQVFTSIYMEEMLADESWQQKWIAYGEKPTTLEPPALTDTDEAKTWIDQVVEAFCNQFELTDKIVLHEQEGADQ